MTINQNLHIGLIGPLPPPYGGMANQLNQLHQLLLAEGLQVTVVQTNAPYCCPLIEKAKGIRALFRLLPYLYKVWHTLGKVDVIHVLANSGWSWQLFSAPVLWLAWLRNTPVIVNYRGGEAREYFEKSMRWVRPSLNRATAIVVPSTYLQQVFADFDITVQVIPNIINLECFHAKQRKSFDPVRPHLLITRNLEAIYGIATAIKAVALLRETLPAIKLTIAGSGAQGDELQQLVHAEGLLEQVHFTGKLPPEDIARLYQQADIMLNPTTVDNMPNSVLEALASGVAVVTTNVGGIPYILQDNKTALFTEVNNPQAMATQIQNLLNNPKLYETLVENGLQDVQQYAWTAVKKLWLACYESVKK